MVDVEMILELIGRVRVHLKGIKDEEELKNFLDKFNVYGSDLHQLLKRSAHRQADLKTQAYKDDIAAARSSLRTSSRLLYTSSKAHIKHPESDTALENQDYSLDQLDTALNSISEAVQAFGEGTQHPFEAKGDLLQLFEDILDRTDRPEEHFKLNSSLKELMQFKTNDLSHFLNHIDYVVKSADGSPVDDKAFRDSTRQVYKGFRNLRRTVRRRNPNASVHSSDDESGSDEEEELIEITEQVS